ncbi:hypothetical protein DICPUDRAFT_156811 [Dictyostelium purpureum]|uniref:MHD domain-containing protein n=1 Tax=Dictyostelium purpureum TaxID=5786 RepID=F0ZXH8_DICPU|nr:uncharacterized protein DICPUDRAFT_156811 [Dictyostelium purpureum]EGC31352.1 hypothetical protein DICPUDRAFT_156811 [Dictyostelium purpureum]|eukprot:XP_003292128.1 hypothetical protein DICPUDRAFT_156811 [Dictyostelium purpureum]
MCTLRGVWILKENNNNGVDIILTKRINTVECRVRALSGLNYKPIPSDSELLQLFNTELLKDSQGYQIESQQTSSNTNNTTTTTASSQSLLSQSLQNKQIQQQQQTTISTNASTLVKIYQSTPNTHIISLGKDKLWPFIYIKKKNYYYVTIAVVEEYLVSNKKPLLIDLPQITAALNFLEEISNYMIGFFNKPPPYPEIQIFLTNIIPFGQPIDTNFNNIKSMIRQGFPATETFQQKRPAWKPFLHKGKQQLDFIICENIQCILYDNPSIPDVSKISGSLICKADLEGMPEVSFYFLPSPNSDSMISNLSIDSSVQTTSDITINNKISFCPPLDHFKVLSYGVSGVKAVPLRGFYQMKEISVNSVKILIQLKLNGEMNNSFDYCLLKIPFKNRGNILQVNASPTTGTVHIDSSLKSIIWNVGQKFTGRNLEVALPAEIVFTSNTQPPIPPTLIVSGGSGSQNVTAFPNLAFPIIDQSSSDVDDPLDKDPFCIGSNSYIRIFFKIQSCTLSGLNIDTKKVIIYPTTKFKLNVEREIVSNDYVIWNSLGSSKYSYQPNSLVIK